MIQRQPVTPNNRIGRMDQFMQSLGSQAVVVKFPKAKETATVFHYARAGRQNSEGFGGGRVVGR